MKNLELLKTLIGKKIENIIWHGSHGDVMEIIFHDGTILHACTYANTIEEQQHSKHDLYVSINEQEI